MEAGYGVRAWRRGMETGYCSLDKFVHWHISFCSGIIKQC